MRKFVVCSIIDKKLMYEIMPLTSLNRNMIQKYLLHPLSKQINSKTNLYRDHAQINTNN